MFLNEPWSIYERRAAAARRRERTAALLRTIGWALYLTAIGFLTGAIIAGLRYMPD